MEKTFEDLYTELQTETGDSSAGKLISFKSWLNRGLTIMQGRLKIQFVEEERLANAVADQDRYQRPEDAVRIMNIRFDDGSRRIPLIQITDDDRWAAMKLTTQSGTPVYYHLIGEDLYELFPTPTGDSVDAIVLTIKRRQKPMYAANYTTGTATISATGLVVVGSGTTFTAAMVGRKLRFIDGTGDGIWYRIAAFTDTTHLTLENYYNGAATSFTGGSYIIGDVPNLPVEMHTTLYDYAMWRYLLGKRDFPAAKEMKNIWETDLSIFEETYQADTEQQVFQPEPDINVMTNLMQIPENIT